MEEEQAVFWGKYKYYLLLILIGSFTFFNSLFNSFVWDDISQIVYNPIVQSLHNIPYLFLGGTFPPVNGYAPVGAYYRPLETVIYTIFLTTFGLQPFFLHLFQVTFHIANGILIFILFKKFFKEKIAFFASLIFLIHPMQVDGVAYIGTLHTPLYFFFGITVFFLSINQKLSFQRKVLVSTFLLCSFLFNETGLLFAISILLYQLIFVQKKSSFLQLSACIAIPGALYLYLRFFLGKIYFAQNTIVPIMAASFYQRLLTMPSIFLYYIKTFFIPSDLFIDQKWVVTHADNNFYIPLAIDGLCIIIIILLGIFIYRNRKKLFFTYLFFLSWFLLGILFHIQLYPLDMTVADHWFYFPMVGLLGLLSVGISTISVSPRIQKAATGIIICIIAILSFTTIIQNTYWQNGISLYTHSFAIIKGSKVENLLAIDLYNAGRYTEAQKHFEYLLSITPKEPSLYYNLALVYEAENNLQKAKRTYQKLIILDGEEKAYANLARILAIKENNPTEAKIIATKGLIRYPKSYYLWLVLSVADYKLGNQKEALTEIQKAKDIFPNPEADNIYQSITNHTPI